MKNLDDKIAGLYCALRELSDAVDEIDDAEQDDAAKCDVCPDDQGCNEADVEFVPDEEQVANGQFHNGYGDTHAFRIEVPTGKTLYWSVE